MDVAITTLDESHFLWSHHLLFAFQALFLIAECRFCNLFFWLIVSGIKA